MSLVDMAIAWVLNNPAVTSAIIGPAHDGAAHEPARRASTSRSTTDVLDRIDEIVPPGTNFNPSDSGYQPPMVADPRTRRRHG